MAHGPIFVFPFSLFFKFVFFFFSCVLDLIVIIFVIRFHHSPICQHSIGKFSTPQESFASIIDFVNFLAPLSNNILGLSCFFTSVMVCIVIIFITTYMYNKII